MKMLTRVAVIVAFAGCASAWAAEKSVDKAQTKGGDTEAVTVLLLLPVDLSKQSLSNGCWAQLYDERNFKGDAFTMVGPMQLDSADKAAGRSFRRQLDSLVVGPKATLTLYEHSMFKDKSVKFGPNSKEGGLVKKLGFSGRVESAKLECSGG